jgi:hypothetical protein
MRCVSYGSVYIGPVLTVKDSLSSSRLIFVRVSRVDPGKGWLERNLDVSRKVIDCGMIYSGLRSIPQQDIPSTLVSITEIISYTGVPSDVKAELLAEIL